MNTEHRTKARIKYSNLEKYGSDGMYRKIIAPTIVMEQPAIFNLVKPIGTANYQTYMPKIRE